MAERKRPAKKLGGPYLAAAFFCERTLAEPDGAITAVRIIDRMTVDVAADAPPDFPPEANGLHVPIHALLAFRTGDSPGEHLLRLVMESPSGKKHPFSDHTLTLTPEPHGGANLRVNGIIAVKTGGLFWLHVFLDGKRLTRMPLQISVRCAEPQPDAPATPTPPGRKKGGSRPPRSGPK
jgi:hypothetical protein